MTVEEKHVSWSGYIELVFLQREHRKSKEAHESIKGRVISSDWTKGSRQTFVISVSGGRWRITSVSMAIVFRTATVIFVIIDGPMPSLVAGSV